MAWVRLPKKACHFFIRAALLVRQAAMCAVSRRVFILLCILGWWSARCIGRMTSSYGARSHTQYSEEYRGSQRLHLALSPLLVAACAVYCRQLVISVAAKNSAS